MSVSAMEHLISRYNKERGVKITSCHAFRRTFASNYIVMGGQLLDLQRLLGHKSIEMTQRYIKLYSKDYTKNFDKYSLVEQYSTAYKVKRAR